MYLETQPVSKAPESSVDTEPKKPLISKKMRVGLYNAVILGANLTGHAVDADQNKVLDSSASSIQQLQTTNLEKLKLPGVLGNIEEQLTEQSNGEHLLESGNNKLLEDPGSYHSPDDAAETITVDANK